MRGELVRKIIEYAGTQAVTYVAKDYAVPFVSEQIQKYVKDPRIVGVAEIGAGMGLQYLADELDKRGIHPLITLLVRVTGMVVGAEGWKELLQGLGLRLQTKTQAVQQVQARPVRVVAPAPRVTAVQAPVVR